MSGPNLQRNADAEGALLGWLLTDPQVIWRDGVVGDLFAGSWERQAFGVVRELSVKGERVSIIGVAAALKLRGVEVDGQLAKLTDLGVTAKHGGGPAELVAILRDCHRRRELERLGRLAVKLAQSGEDDSATAAAHLSGDFATIGVDSALELVELPDAVGNAAAEVAAKKPGELDGLPTGFSSLDRELGGLPFGEMTVLCGRPSQGKSALAQQIAEQVAVTFGAGGDDAAVLMCSPEMHRKQLAYRTIARRAGVPIFRLRFASLSDDEREEIRAVPAATPRVLVYDDGNQTTDDVKAAARKARARHGRVGLVIVDHLQYLAPVDPKAARDMEQEISNRSKACKMLARELGCPVLVLSQLNREFGKRKDPRPRMTDLRGSGAIEQDADVILAVHRPGYYSGKAEDADVAELITLKARNGSTGTVLLGWEGMLAGFRER